MQKYRIAILALLALFALSAAACFFSFAYVSGRGFVRKNLLEKQAAFQRQEEEFQSLREEHAEWKRLPDELRRFNRERLISMDDYAVFRRDLNLCLDDNGFPAPNISSQFGAVQGDMRRLSLNFGLNGSYRSLKKFIFDMERKQRLHFFESIDFSGGDEIRAAFVMEAYLEK